MQKFWIEICRLSLLILLTGMAVSAQQAKDVRSQINFGAVPVTVTAPTTNAAVGTIITIPINVSSTSGLGIFGYRFQITFDPAVLQPFGPNFGCIEAGSQSSGSTATCNLFPNAQTITVFWFRATPALSGTQPLIYLRFQVIGAVGTVSPLQWQDFFFNEGGPSDPVDITVNGLITVVGAGTTAASTSVAGVAMSASGRPISKARVTIADDSGNSQTVLSNAFGFYRFNSVPVGETYVVSALAKRYTFAPQTVSVTDQVSSLNLIADQ